MPLLNAMFKKKSNAVFNNALAGGGRISRMSAAPPHASMKRLYDALKKTKGIEGQSAAADLLKESPQLLNNWESRGMSKMGAVKVQRELGISASWLLSGDGEMLVAGQWPFNPALLSRILKLKDPALKARIEGAIEGSLYAIESGELQIPAPGQRKNGTR